MDYNIEQVRLRDVHKRFGHLENKFLDLHPCHKLSL